MSRASRSGKMIPRTEQHQRASLLLQESGLEEEWGRSGPAAVDKQSWLIPSLKPTWQKREQRTFGSSDQKEPEAHQEFEQRPRTRYDYGDAQ